MQNEPLSVAHFCEKIWEVADFKGIVTNGLNKKLIDFGAFLAGFRLKTPLFLYFSKTLILTRICLKILQYRHRAASSSATSLSRSV